MTSQPGLETISIHTDQYLTKQRQSANEIWSITRT